MKPFGPLASLTEGRALHGRRRRRGLMALLVLGLVLVLGVIVWLQTLQHRLLSNAVRIDDDYFSLNLNQLEAEYLRLLPVWAAAGRGEVGQEALQLRYDIFVSRVDLTMSARDRGLLPEAEATQPQAPQQVAAFVARADRLLGPQPQQAFSIEAVRPLEPELQALASPIHALTVDVAHRVAERIAERNMAVRRNNLLSAALTLLLLSSLTGMLVVVIRQMGLLEQRRASLEDLAGRLQQASQQAHAAAEAKQAFLATMSHELRTPFQGVLGTLELLQTTPLEASQRGLLATAADSARHLLTLLNDVLDMSKLDAGAVALAPAPVVLRELMSEVDQLMRPVAEARGLRLVRDDRLPADLVVSLDATRVRQVLYNLLNNAIKFSDAGEVRLATHADETLLHFRVTDQGIGMDAATVARLFQRFAQGDDSTTRRHGGTGLGLEISRRLARLMGGDISVDSAPGRGSTFSFHCPRVDAPPPSACAPDAPPAASRSLRVLVADDHAVNRLVLSAMLEHLGHRWVCVDSGEEAVAQVQQAHFDAVLLDLRMPGLGGLEAARRIRAVGGWCARVPLLAVTADVLPETRAHVQAAGMDDFLPKPLDHLLLARALQQWCPEATASAPASATALASASAPASASASAPALAPHPAAASSQPPRG